MHDFRDPDYDSENIHEITQFSNQIIARRKTPAKRNQARYMKMLALEGLQMCCSAHIKEAADEELTAQMEAE